MADADLPDDPNDESSSSDHFGSNNLGSNPFAGLPMFADLARQLQSSGPLNWEIARQFAVMGATEGHSEPNVDPTVRLSYTELARIAALQVTDVTGSDVTFPEPRVVNRSQWAAETLTAYRPLFNDLALSLGQSSPGDALTADPMAQMMSGLNQVIAPSMMGMAVGSMVGALSKRAFGLHDLPIPRENLEVVLIATNIDQFAAEWELALDEVRLWVLTHEMAGYSVFSIPHVREQLTALVRQHIGAFQPDPGAISDKLASFDAGDDPMNVIQQAFSDPEILLGAVSSTEQKALQPQLDAAVAFVVGYTDWVVDAVAVRLIGGDALSIAEAARRRRLAAATDDVYIKALLGIQIGNEQVGRGKQFVQGVVDRVGETELSRLMNEPGSLPTPNEIDAPGLWVARVSGQ